ncbi:hypothetical protein [Halobaculum sp. P14]|uniref:hypothetical protein n=1 Tax=Halobaculum sp. P14 TaxID=3421638 RepID=UPI003EC0890E
MVEAAAAVLLFVLLGVGAPLVLYALVREERRRDAETVSDRESAERAARRDVDDDRPDR